MVIAIQKGLEHIKEMVRERGYETVTLGEYNYPIDAVLYNGHGINTSYISNNNMPNAVTQETHYGGVVKNYGVLMVNVQNKTIDEIVTILKNRVYSNLF